MWSARLRGVTWRSTKSSVNPTEWKRVYDDDDTVVKGMVGKFPISEFTEVGKWTVRLLIKDDNQTKEARGSIDVG